MGLFMLEEVCEEVKGACEVGSAVEEPSGVPGEIMGTYSAGEVAEGCEGQVWKEAGGEAVPRGFWARQFAGAPTGAQSRFDIAFGLVIPVLCFIFDPVVFQEQFNGFGNFYRPLRFYAYSLSAAEVLALGCWLFYGARASRWAGLASGFFFAGAVFSFALGLAILPLSVVGLMFVVGALGFVPFLTAFVYLRVAVRARRLAREGAEAAGRTASWVALGLAFGLVAPAAGQRGVNRAVAAAFEEVSAGHELSRPRALTTRALAAVSGATFDEVVWMHDREADPARRARLAKAYAAVTGETIEERSGRMRD